MGQESQASSCVEEFNSSCLSNCSRGDRPLVDLYVELAGFVLTRCRGQGPHLGMTGESRGFSQGAAGFSNYNGEYRLPLVLAQGSPIIHSSCEGELGIALER